MKALLNRAMAMLLGVFACFAQAAMEEGAALAPEPTVSVFWVAVFMLLFVGICIWIGVAIWRSERKNRASSNNA